MELCFLHMRSFQKPLENGLYMTRPGIASELYIFQIYVLFPHNRYAEVDHADISLRYMKHHSFIPSFQPKKTLLEFRVQISFQ